MMTEIHPAILYFGAVALIPLFVGQWRNRLLIIAAALGLLTVYLLPVGTMETLSFLGRDLVVLRLCPGRCFCR
jgi:hypothetical protein